jgi:hypothetical protein
MSRRRPRPKRRKPEFYLWRRRLSAAAAAIRKDTSESITRPEAERMARYLVCGARWRKEVHSITDRAKRYRSRSPECRPPGPRICFACGASARDVHHIDGDESRGPRV